MIKLMRFFFFFKTHSFVWHHIWILPLHSCQNICCKHFKTLPLDVFSIDVSRCCATMLSPWRPFVVFTPFMFDCTSSKQTINYEKTSAKIPGERSSKSSLYRLTQNLCSVYVFFTWIMIWKPFFLSTGWTNNNQSKRAEPKKINQRIESVLLPLKCSGGQPAVRGQEVARWAFQIGPSELRGNVSSVSTLKNRWNSFTFSVV